MRSLSTAFGIIFFLLRSASGESGSSPDDGFEDEELENYDFSCFSQLQVDGSKHTLTCSFEDSTLDQANLKIELCGKFLNENSCQPLEKPGGVYFLKTNAISLIGSCTLCAILEKKRKNCKVMTITKIVKPEAPFGINVTHRKRANDFLMTFNTTHAWKDYAKDLVHDVAYRQKKSDWMHINSTLTQIIFLERKLQPGAAYEVKVRSIPDGNYFKGTWSEWSASAFFETPPKPTEGVDPVLLSIVLLTFSFVAVLVILICVFWKNRIKPVLWPNLPDHKKTLEHLCKRPKMGLNISFNPESLKVDQIHKVDDIQAKEEVQNFLQAPPPPGEVDDLSEKLLLRGGLQGPDWPSENNQIPPVTFGGNSPTGSLNRNFKKGDLSLDPTLKFPSQLEGSKKDGHLYSGLLIQASPAGGNLGFPFPLKSGLLKSSAAPQGQPSSAASVLSHEYVTMSSFYQNQ
ncbi:interleukin-7 receptor subunit alpha [Ornithorhynchus anatinus]|uniref:Interleukin-7 receptor subunit alpha n=1 Tax=Ornithorhynchus anatinus TaxID=9258 RepID=F7A0L8_ORNAN|nr:interleukin-7 receptor subunit alpha [Ornithorhynchus anatinus]